MIILIGGEKGGTGKTTIATNLAAMRAIEIGSDNLLLADADKQQTATLWCSTRNLSENVKTKITSVQKTGDISQDIESLNKKYSDVIIDAGGYDSFELRSGMLVADLLISPFRAGQFDIWTMSKMNEHIKRAKLLNPKLKVLILLSQASFQPQLKKNEIKDMLDYLEEFPDLILMDTVLVTRQAYRKSAILGQSVLELLHDKTSGVVDKNAESELKQLYAEIFVKGN
jgi:chromosome partitioning protein